MPAHSHDEGRIDLCSPFCTCQCCHVGATNFKFNKFKVVAPLINSILIANFFYLVGSGIDCYNKILQPPRA
ncbi:DUF6660 family protein [Balneicella halophila]|uniref:DUF6660 family protein n=1 Tax=Balneicella halophila TaxID=1537566 RepID=UPI0037431619